MLVLFDVSCLAFLFALILTPLIRNAANRMGFVDHPEAGRKVHVLAVPRVGGVGIALAYALALGFVAIAPYKNMAFDIPGSISTALRLAPAAVVILLIGLADDIRGLRPWQKLLGEVVAASIAYASGFGVYVLRGEPVSDWLSPILTVVWLVGCCNALNLIDGIDGLAAGVGVFAALTAFLAALVHNSLGLALVTAPLIGALIGFLRYNFNPASIFLGDSGSLLIGFLLGCFGATWSQKSATLLGMTAPLIALAMPLLDTALAIARRFLRGQPIFSADRGHIHHRLLDRGLTPRRVTLLLYGACGLAAAFSLIQEVGHDRFGGLIIILFCVAAWVGVQHLGYAEFGIAGRLVLRGSFRNMVNAQLQLQQFECKLGLAESIDDSWKLIVAGAAEFGWSGIRLQLCGRVWDSMPYTKAAGHWQLRVPLSSGQYVNLSHDPAVEIHPLVLASFPGLLERFLISRFTQSAEGVKA